MAPKDALCPSVANAARSSQLGGPQKFAAHRPRRGCPHEKAPRRPAAALRRCVISGSRPSCPLRLSEWACFERSLRCRGTADRVEGAALSEEAEMSVLDDYLVDPKLSLLDKTRIQAQVLVPVLRALRSELGREKAEAIVKQALRDWSKQLFAAIGDGIEGGPRHKWAALQAAWAQISEPHVTAEQRRHDKGDVDVDIT